MYKHPYQSDAFTALVVTAGQIGETETACEQDMTQTQLLHVAAYLRESMMATSTRAGRTDDEEDHYFVSRVRANPEESTELRAIARGAVAPAHHELNSSELSARFQ